MSDQEAIIGEYRGLLTATEQKSQTDFDKAILTLSGGGLGISFTFLKEIVGASNAVHTTFLISAWIGWTLSATAILGSFYTSILALRRAIHQLDQGTIGMEPARQGLGLRYKHIERIRSHIFCRRNRDDDCFPQLQHPDQMKSNQIVTNSRRVEGQFTANGRRIPLPPTSLIGRHVPHNAGQAVPQRPPMLAKPAFPNAAPSASQS